MKNVEISLQENADVAPTADSAMTNLCRWLKLKLSIPRNQPPKWRPKNLRKATTQILHRKVSLRSKEAPPLLIPLLSPTQENTCPSLMRPH